MYTLRIINQDYSSYKLVNDVQIELEYSQPELIFGMFDGDAVDIVDGKISNTR